MVLYEIFFNFKGKGFPVCPCFVFNDHFIGILELVKWIINNSELCLIKRRQVISYIIISVFLPHHIIYLLLRLYWWLSSSPKYLPITKQLFVISTYFTVRTSNIIKFLHTSLYVRLTYLHSNIPHCMYVSHTYMNLLNSSHFAQQYLENWLIID